MDFLDLQDKVFTYFAEEFYKEQVEPAKKEFIELTGPFDEEDDSLEEKMTHFREWFLFDYEISQQSLIEQFEEREFAKLELPVDYLKSFQESEKSIFMFVKMKNDQVYVKDLFSKEKKVIENSPFLVGIEKGTYIQAQLFEIDGKLCFGQSIITHPYESRKFIDRKIKLLKKSIKKSVEDVGFLKKEFFKELLSMRYHLIKYKQLEVSKIYSDDSPVKELQNKALKEQ